MLIGFLTALLSQTVNRNHGSSSDPETFSGLIYEQPVVDGRYKMVTVNRNRIYIGRYTELNQGDYINLDFKSCKYSEKYNSYDNCKILIDPSRQNPFMKRVLKVRNRIISNAKTRLPAPHDLLILAMTIGYEDDLPETLTEKLREIGAIHMLVVSGYNVSLILNSSGVVLMRFPRWIYLILSVFLLLMFILLTGFDAPIVRSVIMGTFVVVSKAYSRPTAALYLLILSAVIMLSWDFSYLSNISFQLSFGATFGVIISGYIFKNQNSFLSNMGASVGASVFVLPILSFYFGIISFLGIISTVLLSWLVPVITYLGFAIFVFDNILIKFVLVTIVDLFLKICDLISHFSFLNIEYKFTHKDLVLYYIFLGMIIMSINSIKTNMSDE
jgi:ComEC/Rec2-related protein